MLICLNTVAIQDFVASQIKNPDDFPLTASLSLLFIIFS